MLVAAVGGFCLGHTDDLADLQLAFLNAGIALRQFQGTDAVGFRDFLEGISCLDLIKFAAQAAENAGRDAHGAACGQGVEVRVRVGQGHGLGGDAPVTGDALQGVAFRRYRHWCRGDIPPGWM